MRSFIYAAILLFVVFVSGVVAGKLYQELDSLFRSELYITTNQQLINRFSTENTYRLRWDELIPQTEKALLEKYQGPRPEAFSEQLLLVFQANSDDEYQSALISTNVVEDVIDRSVSISGFIVPLDLKADRSIKSFFLVPYYGACIHYPPPPPNQIIYVQLEGSLTQYKMENAFTIEGILRKGMFEDPMGTSAYILEAVSITSFEGQPDDFRQH
ncbi:MAG: DUF3299 domain-containing protein [Aestuariibacter sp.]